MLPREDLPKLTTERFFLGFLTFELSPRPKSLALCRSRPTLRAKSLLVLLPCSLKIVCLFLLTFGFSFRTVLFLQPDSFRDRQFCFGIGSLRIQYNSETFGEGRMYKIKGILSIFPRCHEASLGFVLVDRRRVGGWCKRCRRPIRRGNGLDHVSRRETFGGRLIIRHGHFVERAVVERKQNLFDTVGSVRGPWNVRRPPGHFLK